LFAESDSDSDVLFGTSIEKGSVSDLIVDSECTYHMCPYKSNKSCRYCRKPGHVISKCFKLKNKR